jgi:nicotinamidase-related amidase
MPNIGPEKTDGLRFGPLGENWAHVCVDMQRMFAEATEWQAPWLSRVLPSVVALAAASGPRTVFTRFLPPSGPQNLPGTWQRYYERWNTMTLERLDHSLVELVDELSGFAPPAVVIDKRIYSPWMTASFRAFLRDHAVDTIVVSGTETEVCVLSTVLGAVDRGYRVIVATDAICSSADETHDAMLTIYHSRFGMQVETAAVLEILDHIP